MPDEEQEDLSFLDGYDPDELAALAAEGIGEGDFEEDDIFPSPEELEAYEAMEFANAVDDVEGRELSYPDIGVPPPNTPGVERSTPFHTRADWGARPWRTRTAISNPQGDTVHYGGPSPWSGADTSSPQAFHDSTDHNRCASIVRGYQRFHMDTRGWSDIAYNSLTCPHGHRYEGRGPGIRSAAQGTNDGNNRSYATCSLSGDNDPLTDQEKFAFLDEGTPTRMLQLRWGHRDWKSTGCPGNPRYDWKQSGFLTPGGQPPSTPPTPPTQPIPPGGYCTVNLPILRQGARSGAVKSLQSLLNSKAGQGIAVDGIFGPGTDRAVRNVQTFFGIGTDGIVGSKTWGVLFL